MKHILSLLVLTISLNLSAQEDRREIIDGEEFIVHTVKKGETLYGISKKHNVSKKEVRGNNSGMLLFIKVGQEIRIPVSKSERTMHTVKKGETLYGIAKEYNLTIDELVKLNPAKASNLKVGDKLTLRKTNTTPSVKQPKVETNTTTVIKQKPSQNEATIVHVVKKGETLYGIAKLHNIKVSTILKYNPEIKNNSISVGDLLDLPDPESKRPKKDLTELKKTDEPKKYVLYTVKKGETLYGIARKFNTTVDQIKTRDPNNKVLKEGDKVEVTLPPSTDKDIAISLGKPRTPENTNFNEVNKINPLKDKLNEMVKKDAYTISLFLPFMLDKNDRIPVEPNKPKKINSYTEMSTHFYQGVKLALDSVKTSGVSLNLNVYDTENDTTTVGKHLRKSDVKSSDVIIGPFFEKPYSQVAKFSKSNQIQAVCPVSQSNKLLFNNKYVTELKTSLPTQLSYLSSFIASTYNTQNVICVSGKTKKDKYLATMFSTKYNSNIAAKSNNYRSKASTYSMTSFSSMHGFDAKLVKGKKNIIVIPFTEAGMATAFFTQLNILMTRSRMRGYEVEVFALENFMEYEDINVDMKMKYNLHVTSSSFIDYKEQSIKRFVKKYRATYGTEPTKYAFVGFDVAFYHAIAMSNFGKNYTAYYDNIKVPLLQSSYALKRTDNASGFENQCVFILAYKDYELVKIN